MTKLDWKQIDLSAPEGLRRLDRAIAECQGYYIDAYIDDDGELYYALTSPDGKELETTAVFKGDLLASHPDEQLVEATSDVWLFALEYDPEEGGIIPLRSTDERAALELIGTDFSLHIVPQGKGNYGVYLEHLQTEKTHYKAESSIAVAICKAWLAWMDSQVDAK